MLGHIKVLNSPAKMAKDKVRIDADAMQRASVEGSSQTASQLRSRMSIIDDALRNYMSPCLGLGDIMRFAGTCSQWHRLVMETPLHHLSKGARCAPVGAHFQSAAAPGC